MDIVYIRDLHIDTIIGVFDWEREVKQRLVFDIDMATDTRRAGQTDDLEFALDYYGVSNRVTQFVEQSRCLLVERLAEEVAALIMSEFSVPWLKLRLGKPGAVKNARDVGLVIERGVKP
ncbi:MAG: dihydroneopterin aldolase [Porticoccaceae bacterium]